MRGATGGARQQCEADIDVCSYMDEATESYSILGHYHIMNCEDNETEPSIKLFGDLTL